MILLDTLKQIEKALNNAYGNIDEELGFADEIERDILMARTAARSAIDELENAEPLFWLDEFGNRESEFQQWMKEEIDRGVKWIPLYTYPPDDAKLREDADTIVGDKLGLDGLGGSSVRVKK